MIIHKAKGPYLYDIHGKRYIDLISGYSAANFGHLNKEIIKTVKDQLKISTITSRAVYHDTLGKASSVLCNTFRYDKVIFTNTGCEAVETAIKFARKRFYQRNKSLARGIFFQGNFHGRSISVCGGSDEE